ncbi:MAG: phospho-sugar mutase [Lachnospiraceae bacterium]|nr:phospho-sugar mutase [Lachnospiraceae bacterium]
MNLKFGTGGLRAVMGEGPDSLNIETIKEATLGVASYIKKEISQPNICICYDSRNQSWEFAKEAAEIFALKGCEVFIGRTLMPTPFLSYVVRELKCDMGVCITASHNAKEYNGYKVYGKDGCQITKNAAKDIQEEIRKVKKTDFYEEVSFEEYHKCGKIKYIPEVMIEKFCGEILRLGFHENDGSDLKIVYSPLNGAGKTCVMNVLREKGFQNIHQVEEQSEPDGNFPTCPYPNPEDDKAMELGVQLSKKIDADIFLATDPDSDRVGVVAKKGRGYQKLNGNQVGILLLDYLLKTRKEKGNLPENPVIIKTIVTTEMVKKIAKEYGAEVIETLTGFKYIGEQIGELEQKGEIERFVFGVEESCGYLIGTYVRDKDAIGAIMLLCEMADLCKKQGKTLWDQLQELYQKYGYYESVSKTQNIDRVKADKYMEEIRENICKNRQIGNEYGPISYYTDYRKADSNLPKSDVLKIYFEDKSTLIIRPSGTEPKIKFYYESIKQ